MALPHELQSSEHAIQFLHLRKSTHDQKSNHAIYHQKLTNCGYSWVHRLRDIVYL